jgi:GGDEF domain-containing protein
MFLPSSCLKLCEILSFNAQNPRDWKLGISIGHALLGQDSANDFESLIAVADARMYQSRRDKRLDAGELKTTFISPV